MPAERHDTYQPPSNPAAELAPLAEMDRPHPSLLHGLPRSLQRRSHKPLPRPPLQSHVRKHQSRLLQHHHRNHNRRPLALLLDTFNQHLRPASHYTPRNPHHHLGRRRVRDGAGLQHLARHESRVWVWVWRHDERGDGGGE